MVDDGLPSGPRVSGSGVCCSPGVSELIVTHVRVCVRVHGVHVRALTCA